MKAEIGCKNSPWLGLFSSYFYSCFFYQERNLFTWLSCPNECHINKKIETLFHYFFVSIPLGAYRFKRWNILLSLVIGFLNPWLSSAAKPPTSIGRTMRCWIPKKYAEFWRPCQSQNATRLDSSCCTRILRQLASSSFNHQQALPWYRNTGHDSLYCHPWWTLIHFWPHNHTHTRTHNYQKNIQYSFLR